MCVSSSQKAACWLRGEADSACSWLCGELRFSSLRFLRVSICPGPVSADLAQPRFTMLFLAGFAAAALLLTAIGLYGVIAFGVTQRTREIGVRVALGAQYTSILRLVMQRGMLLTGTGLVIGVAAALALGRVMTGLLYGITPTDPGTLVAAALFLASVATIATYLPARRATRLDPTVALRAE